MTTQKIILIVLGVVVVAGLGFLIVKEKNKPIDEGNGPTPVAEEPTQEPTQQPPKNPPSTTTNFSKSVSLKINDKATFPDGLVVELNSINDSRCQPDVQCFWQGELGGNFTLSSGKLKTSEKIYLGTVTKKSVTLNGYTFDLKDITTSNATIIVTYKKPVVAGSCYVGGCSAEVCSDQRDVASNCIYKEEFACYKTAKCERQTSGECGWTETPALTACLSK